MNKLFFLLTFCVYLIKADQIEEWITTYIEPMDQTEQQYTYDIIHALYNYTCFDVAVRRLTWINVLLSHTIEQHVASNQNVIAHVNTAQDATTLLIKALKNRQQAIEQLENLSIHLETIRNDRIAQAIETMRINIQQLLIDYATYNQETVEQLIGDAQDNLQILTKKLSCLSAATLYEPSVTDLDKIEFAYFIKNRGIMIVHEILKNLKDLHNHSILTLSITAELLNKYAQAIAPDDLLDDASVTLV